MKFLLVVATIADLGLAALLIAVSGFVFGGGPDSGHGDTPTAVVYIGAVVACAALPVAGFALHAKGKTGAGLLAAFLPLIGGLIMLVIPAPY